MDIGAQINRFLEPLRIRIKMVLQRALLTLIDDSTNMQTVQLDVMKGEVQSSVERIQNYGFTSVPEIGSEVLLLSFGGNRDNPIAIAVENSASRLKGLASGEVAMYDRNENYILLKADGSTEIVPPQGVLRLGSSSLSPLAGVVTGECLDPVTGVPFPDKSAKIFARKL